MSESFSSIERNPVLDSAKFITEHSKHVTINTSGIDSAARFIRQSIIEEKYTPATWRTQPLHFLPPMPFTHTHPRTKKVIDWIFLVSALNFSFWSDRDESTRFGIQWYESGWKALRSSPASRRLTTYTGYWTLPAAINKALEQGIPFTEPAFYSDPARCSDETIAKIFTPAPRSLESMPLITERIDILREVGSTLCQRFGGSFLGVIEEWQRRHGVSATALQLVKLVVETFPSFRDQVEYGGRRVYLWKRAQILVAEMWAAFHPSDNSLHPFFPNGGVSQLTMFADYRVPQILHTLGIITYSTSLISTLSAGTSLKYGSEEELSLRAASILAVERIRAAIANDKGPEISGMSSVLLDFWLWDTAKRVELGEVTLPGVERPQDIVPVHRTSSIWY